MKHGLRWFEIHWCEASIIQRNHSFVRVDESIRNRWYVQSTTGYDVHMKQYVFYGSVPKKHQKRLAMMVLSNSSTDLQHFAAPRHVHPLVMAWPSWKAKEGHHLPMAADGFCRLANLALSPLVHQNELNLIPEKNITHLKPPRFLCEHLWPAVIILSRSSPGASSKVFPFVSGKHVAAKGILDDCAWDRKQQ